MVKWDPGKIIRDPRGEITGVARDSSAQRACDVIRAWIDCILNRAKKWSVCLRSDTSPLMNNEKKKKHRSSGKSFFFHYTGWMSYEVSMASSLHMYSLQFHYKHHQWREVQKILNGRNSCIIEVRLVIYCRRFCFSPTYAHRSLSTCLGKSRVEAVRWNYM